MIPTWPSRSGWGVGPAQHELAVFDVVHTVRPSRFQFVDLAVMVDFRAVAWFKRKHVPLVHGIAPTDKNIALVFEPYGLVKAVARIA
jgi:hypothetical protein